VISPTCRRNGSAVSRPVPHNLEEANELCNAAVWCAILWWLCVALSLADWPWVSSSNPIILLASDRGTMYSRCKMRKLLWWVSAYSVLSCVYHQFKLMSACNFPFSRPFSMWCNPSSTLSLNLSYSPIIHAAFCCNFFLFLFFGARRLCPRPYLKAY
jgi:hypothetical protein